MRARELGTALLVGAAMTLATPAHADTYCFTEDCVYAGEGALLLGGVVAALGSSASIFDDDPSDAWSHIGYTVGALNLVAGSIIFLVGAGSAAEERYAVMGIGGGQAGLGLLCLFTAALAEGHYDAIDEVRSQHVAEVPLLLPLIDVQQGTPSGMMLTATF